MTNVSKIIQDIIPPKLDMASFAIDTVIHEAVDSTFLMLDLESKFHVLMNITSEMLSMLLKSMDIKVILNDGTVGRATFICILIRAWIHWIEED